MATAGGTDKMNVHSQLEHLQSKVPGTGHADTTRHEWAVNMHRDTAASFVGHPHLASYLAVAENEALGRVRYRLLSKMVAPCGPPPKPADE